jgi:acetoin utilization deacetylase AcuC-like enzyme
VRPVRPSRGRGPLRERLEAASTVTGAPVVIATHPGHTGHAQPGHPESPERVVAVLSRLAGFGPKLTHVEAVSGPAVDEAIRRIHSDAHLARLDRAAAGSGTLDADTYTTRDSVLAARGATAAGLAALESVLDGRARSAMAVVRPPGHHAEPERTMGFCLINHVAVLARAAQVAGCERVAILDWDVHHGNGTQAAFLTDPTVFFASLHQWPLYPGTGWFTETGVGAGVGATLNVPLPAGTGDAGYAAAFERLVAPAVAQFGPDILLVSAGFDAHWRDPLASQLMTTDGFGSLAASVIEMAGALCGGRVVATLEGGYDLDALAEGTGATVGAFAGVADPGPRTTRAPPWDEDVDEALARIEAIRRAIGG